MQPSLSLLPPDASRVLILVNPTAGRRRAWPRVNRLVELLEQRDFQVQVSTELAEAALAANRWHGEGRLRALVGVGGDGTAAALVNRTVAGLPITMLPAGNENLLARYLRLDEDPEACCRSIAAGRVIRLDAARAGDRIFLLMASCGFDADVVHRLHRRRRGHIRTSSYVRPILDSIRGYKYPELQITCDADDPPAGPRQTPLAARWLFAFNLPCYGGGLRIAPQADGSDGLLDICTFRRGGLRHGLAYAAAIYLQRHFRLADFAHRRLRRLRVASAAEVPYQLDGDPGGFLPVEIEALPQRLTLVVPPA
ncbi:MAG: diacylglycerol kinase family protein [Thermoguttaceae bacterium]